MTAMRLPAVSTWSVGQCDVWTQRPRKSPRPGKVGVRAFESWPEAMTRWRPVTESPSLKVTR